MVAVDADCPAATCDVGRHVCNPPKCGTDADCASGSCNVQAGVCRIDACAEAIYVGHVLNPDGTRKRCQTDANCTDSLPGSCDRSAPALDGTGLCLAPVRLTNLYELATSNYLAGGGSGYRVLQRNTTQFDTKIQQRDALIDYMRQGHPCGYNAAFDTPEKLKRCANDADCASEGDFVCACPGKSDAKIDTGTLTCVTKPEGCDPGVGRCVRKDCRDETAQFHDRKCATSPETDRCRTLLNPCSIGGEECKILSCVDRGLGNYTDNRTEMLGR